MLVVLLILVCILVALIGIEPPTNDDGTIDIGLPDDWIDML